MGNLQARAQYVPDRLMMTSRATCRCLDVLLIGAFGGAKVEDENCGDFGERMLG
jgi:hypothetical protein